MRTLTPVLATFDEDKAARFRGLVLGRLMRAAPGQEPGLLHLFLLPPQPGRPRFLIYETSQPLNLEVPATEAIQQVLDTLRESGGDPRQVVDSGQWWRTVDSGRQALYLGTGARFASSAPDWTCTTIARLVDRTACYLTLDADRQPLILRASEAVILNDEPFPATDEIPTIEEPPFVLIDTVLEFLR